MTGVIMHLPAIRLRVHVFNRIAWAAILFFAIFAPISGFGQAKENYDEISITLNVKRIGSLEIPAVILGQEAYLPIKELFDFLKIKNTLSENLDSVWGFFIDPKAIFFVDKINNRIV